MQSQKNGFMMKNSKNGSVDGFDQYNEKAASQRNDGINQGLENKDELRDLQSKLNQINKREKGVTSKVYFDPPSPTDNQEKELLLDQHKSGGKEKRAFVIEVDDLHDVETINNLLDDPVTNLLQQNSDIVFLSTQNNLFNIELPLTHKK